MARASIPERIEELTPEWLTGALRASGALGEGRVARVRAEVLGEGEGFVGRIARLHLEYAGPRGEAPDTLVAKIPTPVDQNRSGGEMLGLYEREIMFYRHLAPELTIPTPRLYHAELDANPAAPYGLRILRFLERLPWWLLRVVVRCFQWLAGRVRRRYVLLLQDLAPARVGDQVAGCTPDQARSALRALARAQAKMWGSPQLAGRYWLAPIDIAPRLFHVSFRRSRKAFEARFAARLPAHVTELIEWLETHEVALCRRLGEGPTTFIHGDFRLDNLFFSETAPGVIAADWQGISTGPGVFDAAYFLSGSVAAEMPQAEIEQLLRCYHAELVAQGVQDYDFAACRRDYERSLVLLLHRMVMVDMMDLGQTRGQDLIYAWLERLAARLEGVRVEALLEPSRA